MGASVSGSTGTIAPSASNSTANEQQPTTYKRKGQEVIRTYALLVGLFLLAIGLEVGGYELLLNTRHTALALAMLATGILAVKPLAFLLVAIVAIHILIKLKIGKPR